MYKKPTSTKYEDKLAFLLDRYDKNLKFKRNPEIWLSSCIWYTPDFIIGKSLVVEVDGGIHSEFYRKTPDRIRQRALENIGFKVIRINNDDITKFPKNTVDKIRECFFAVSEENETKYNMLKDSKQSSFIYPIKNRTFQDNSQDNKEIDTRQLALEFHLKFIKDKENEEEVWNANFFKEHLSFNDKKIVENSCAMERFMLQLMGLNLKKRKESHDESFIDFLDYSEIFNKSIRVLDSMFNSNIFGLYLKNAFNITAPNFIKNLVFNGGPKINPGVVSIKDKDKLEKTIIDFNQSFNKMDIFVDRHDVIIECIEEIKKIKRIDNNKKSHNEYDKTLKNTIETFAWIEETS